MRLLLVVSLMARLFLEAGVILRMMFGFGQAGRKHPNGKFPFIHRENFMGIVSDRFGIFERVSHHSVFERPIVGFSKRNNRKD
jgi:hypothetical protein